MKTNDRSVAFSTLGCKLNLYETDALSTRFRAGGYHVVEFDQPADVYVINSCTVTNRADRKSRNLFSRAKRGRPPLVVLTGCFVDSHRDELESDSHTLVVPNEQKSAILDLVEAHVAGEVIHPESSVFDFPVPDRSVHTRTMIKVQDGCDNYCSFCIIPRVRGRATSRPPDAVVGAAREAVDGGAHEIVLTGVNMSRYECDGVRFAGLVRRILDINGDFRVRISSLEPDGLGDDFIDLFRHPRMCHHLHLCLQSASERILLAMRRQYTYTEYWRIADQLRSIDPLFNLTTDILVGFPGETEDEFAKSVDCIAQIGFGHVHTFPYSEREGTRAARMPGRIPERVRTERAAAIRAAAEKEKTQYRKRLLGAPQRLLIERIEDGWASGFGEYYVPMRVASDSDEVNVFAPAVATHLSADREPHLVVTDRVVTEQELAGTRCRS